MDRIPDAGQQPFVPLWSDDEPCAGRWLGLGRSGTYQAAQRGEIAVLRFGRRAVVPTAWLRRQAQLDEPAAES